ncbi:hypothetical protein Goshw_003649, partial [Gossypium schwendimanii]|nr:hypothetical protein [Gossypium schwendimanii]
LNEPNRQSPLAVPPKAGNWIQLNSGRALKESTCSVFDAELWDIFEGVAIAIDKGFDRVFIIPYSQETIQAIQ